MLWLVLALMTAAAVFAVLWPLARGHRVDRGASDAVVYRDQLEEIERDRAADLIGVPEAEAARIEVSRRLLSVAGAQDDPAATTAKPPLWRKRCSSKALRYPLQAARAVDHAQLRIEDGDDSGVPLARFPSLVAREHGLSRESRFRLWGF